MGSKAVPEVVCLIFLLEGERLKHSAAWISRQNPQGIYYIYSSYWLVYGWIPTECVLEITGLGDFRSRCAELGIHSGKASFFGPITKDFKP